MLLSDGDLRKEIANSRLVLEPWDPAMLQPSSIDVRLDRHFRVFQNSRYTHIDPAQQQDELTTAVEPAEDEPFVLHPGEFVLGSTFESVSLPDDLAGRLEGKALALDTPIPTPTGWRTMGDLRIGDSVFGADGMPCTVVAATEVMLGRPCYEVLFSDGQTIVADAAHLWVTRTKAARKHRHGATAAVTTAQITGSLRAGDEVNHHVALAAPVQYPVADLPVDPYVLGIWLADGTSTKAEVTCGRGDEQVLDEIQAAGYAVWPANNRIAYRIGGSGRGQTGRTRDGLGRYSADGSLSSTLRAIGVMDNKHVPTVYLQSAPEQRLALLQGLMDSDGHIDNHGRCEFVSIRESLSDSVVELAASLGLRPVKRKKTVMFGGIEHGVAYQVKFTPWMPVFRLSRKLARLKTGGHRHRGIMDVQPVSTRPVRCIQVSAPDGMFLAGRTFIPTHNSSLGRLGLLTHSTAGFIDPGFTGHITLELSNVANLPITLWPGMKIGQLCLFRLSSPAERPYGSDGVGSRYQGQRGPTPSRAHVNFHRTDTRR